MNGRCWRGMAEFPFILKHRFLHTVDCISACGTAESVSRHFNLSVAR